MLILTMMVILFAVLSPTLAIISVIKYRQYGNSFFLVVSIAYLIQFLGFVLPLFASSLMIGVGGFVLLALYTLAAALIIYAFISYKEV